MYAKLEFDHSKLSQQLRRNTAPTTPVRIWGPQHHTGNQNRVRISHTPATVWTMHWPHWLNRPYISYMAILCTKQEAVKLSKMLMKSVHRPYWLPQQTLISRWTA